MSDRRENSVLFSLKELRRIEDDRVRREQDELAARREAERAAKEAAERAAREEEERIRRAEEERIRRAEEEKQARMREEQLRLEEAERRARVEADMQLQQERMRLEVQARAKNSPVKAVLGVSLVLVAIGGGLAYKMYQQHQTEMAAQRAQMALVEQQKARIEAEKAKAEAEYKTQLAAIQKEMDDKLAHATSDIERARIREEATRQAMAVRSKRGSGGSRSSSSGESSPSQNKIKAPGKHEISDNPLEGL
ncbi:MAG TPA: hypothetical protein VHM31_00605 [Polyangia bacterium]|nr:hypothetical protein [Polyangia bacterium]